MKSKSPKPEATRKQRKTKKSNLAFWVHNSSTIPTIERTKVMAKLIDPNTSVLEFGPGSNQLKKFLPKGCKHATVDLVKREVNTILCDLNSKNLPVFPKYDIAFFSGVLEFIHDLPRLVSTLSLYFDKIICSYTTLENLKSKEKRIIGGFYTDFTSKNFRDIFEKNNYKNVYKERFVFNNKKIVTTIFVFEKND